MKVVSEFRDYFTENIKAFNYLIIFLSVFSLFLWEIELYDSFTSRYSIIFLAIFNFLYFKKKDFGTYLLIIIIVFFIYVHLYFNTDEITKRQHISIVFLLLLLCISFKFKIFFTKFFFEISTFYISLINLFIISGLIFYGFEIYNFQEFKNGLCAINYSNGFQEYMRYFFVEPSHLAFLSAPVIVSYPFLIHKKRNKFILFNYLLFVILIVTNYLSASLLLSTLILILLVLIFNYRYLREIKKISILISIFSLYLIVFLSISTCNIRVTQFLKVNLLYDLNEIGIDKDIQKLLPHNDVIINKLTEEESVDISKITEITKEIEGTFKDNNDLIVPYTSGDTALKKYKEALVPIEINMSTIVHINSFAVSLQAIKDKPFGYGFQNYQNAHKQFHIQNYFSFPEMSFYNFNDGASNFTKSVSEFGIFNILFIVLLLLYLIKSKDELPIKVFLVSILITQSIRGAGYFNGSFLFFLTFAILNSGYKLEMLKSLKK